MSYPLFKDNNRISFQLAFGLGLTSMTAQIVLLRELVTVFYGNETAYAIILASWLFWVAAGSRTAGWLPARIKNSPAVLIAALWLTFLVLPATIFFIRSVKTILDLQTGEMIGAVPMFLSSFVVLAPFTFLMGGVFTLICHYREVTTGNPDPGKIYLWESVGASVGGLAFSLVLIHWVSAAQTVFLLGAGNVAATLFLLKKKKMMRILAVVVFAATALAFALKIIDRFDGWTRRIQWRGLEVVDTTDSVYGNLTMTKLGSEYSLFENGLLSYTTRDALSSEENVHFPLLAHPDPRRVLLVGNGVGGELAEILKYPALRVDYVELDPKAIDIAKINLPGEIMGPLHDPRVAVMYTDGRLFIKTTSRRYDVVIINLSDPYTALINRYYTLEFFRELRGVLNPGGIISVSVSSSEDALNREARVFLRSIHTTLKDVFADVQSVPGEKNIFLACPRPGVITRDVGQLIGRLKERGVQTRYVREYYLFDKLRPGRLAGIDGVLKEPGVLNTDMHPVAYLYDIILWSTHFDTAFKNLFENLRGLKFYHLMGVPALVLLAGWGLRRTMPAVIIGLSIFTTGFSQIIFQLIVILAFQSLYGYAYYKASIILSSFMVGLAWGSLTGQRMIGRPLDDILRVYRLSQGGTFLYAFLLPAVFIVLKGWTASIVWAGLLASTFAFLPVIGGFLGGLQYPLATKISLGLRPGQAAVQSSSAGSLYALDVFGASVGALGTGTILIPLLGIQSVAAFAAVLNAAVFVLLLGLRQK